MTQITVSDDQARAIAEASGPIVIVDGGGRALGQIAPVDPAIAAREMISDEEWAEIKSRMQSPGPGFTTKEVLDYLHSLNT